MHKRAVFYRLHASRSGEANKVTGGDMIRNALIFTLIAAPLAAIAQDESVLTKQYDDGGVYEGTFRGGLQHGEGSYKLPNGYEYAGEWVDGEIKGQGVARFPSGAVYEGSFAKGKPEGFGKITFGDGGTYEGCLLYTSPSPRDLSTSRMPSSA